MTDRRARIPAAEITDPKRWNLPYWTTPPHVIQAEREEKARVLAKQKAEQALAEIGEEEIDIEVQPYTAEQLENIRQQAYNEGLEQGLVEGRQKGEALGHEAGYQEGLDKGLAEGMVNGEEQGRQAIEKKLTQIQIQQNQDHAQQVSAILKGMQNFLIKQSGNIEKVLPDIVEKLAQAVVAEELNQGSEHIVALVKQAMDALPISCDHLQIELNEADLPFLEAAFEVADFSAQLKVNKQIAAGGCKIKTQHSQINFTLDERWQRVVQQYHEQLSLASISNLDTVAPDPSAELITPQLDAYTEEQVSQLLAKTDDIDEAQLPAALDAETELSETEHALSPMPEREAFAETGDQNTLDDILENTLCENTVESELESLQSHDSITDERAHADTASQDPSDTAGLADELLASDLEDNALEDNTVLAEPLGESLLGEAPLNEDVADAAPTHTASSGANSSELLDDSSNETSEQIQTNAAAHISADLDSTVDDLTAQEPEKAAPTEATDTEDVLLETETEISNAAAEVNQTEQPDDNH